MSKTLEEAWAELEMDVDFNGAMRFAVSEIQELAVAAERERCAKVADERLRQSRMIRDAGD